MAGVPAGTLSDASQTTLHKLFHRLEHFRINIIRSAHNITISTILLYIMYTIMFAGRRHCGSLSLWRLEVQLAHLSFLPTGENRDRTTGPDRSAFSGQPHRFLGILSSGAACVHLSPQKYRRTLAHTSARSRKPHALVSVWRNERCCVGIVVVVVVNNFRLSMRMVSAVWRQRRRRRRVVCLSKKKI